MPALLFALGRGERNRIMEEVVIISGARTAIGTFGGALKDITAAQLGSAAIRAAVERAGIAPSDVDEVIMGCVGQVGEDAYLARTAAVGAGLPLETPALTVNRLCGSGLESINRAAQAIRAGDVEVVVAGGAENMSRYPYLVRGARWGIKMGDVPFEDALTLGLNDPFHKIHMGITAENLAKKYGISRESQDQFALESQQRATEAIRAGRFEDEIVPISVPQRRGEPKIVATDEHPRPDTTIDALGKLPAAFQKEGSVTAGNASGINDAAAAVVVMSASKAKSLGLRPKMVWRSFGVSGVEPTIMGIGPVPATRKALERAGESLSDINLVECNEAFAAQTLAVGKELGFDWARTNVNGGAVALGHPVGATGAILVVKLMYELERRRQQRGLVTLCIGGGQGIATVFERASAA